MTEQKQDFKHIVRIEMSDIEGKKLVGVGLTKIRGVGHSFSNAICKILNINKNEKMGNLKDKDLENISQILKNPLSFDIPSWMLNRKKDYDSGEDKHLTNIDLKLQKEFDYKRLQKIKSYRGLRLSVGLPVRGQRTRSNFRPNKGKTASVKKKKR